MENISDIREFLFNIGFVEHPSMTPLNSFESIKRDFYLLVLGVSKKMFKFLNEKFPIRYYKERFDRSLWFSLKHNIGEISELSITPHFQGVIIEYYYKNYPTQTVFCESMNVGHVESLLNRDPYLRKIIRQRKLKTLLR